MISYRCLDYAKAICMFIKLLRAKDCYRTTSERFLNPADKRRRERFLDNGMRQLAPIKKLFTIIFTGISGVFFLLN